MISAIKGVVYGFLGFNDQSKDVDENFHDLIKEINVRDEEEDEKLIINNSCIEEKFGQSRTKEYDVEIINYTYKTGKITYIDNEYGFIDGVFYFDSNQVSETLSLKAGDEVVYTTYRMNDSRNEKIDKISSLKRDSWELEKNLKKNETHGNSLVFKSIHISAMRRLVNGFVTKRQDRRCFVEPQNVWCDLNEVEATFVPLEGDWVALDAVVAIDENAVELYGSILNVKSINPILLKSGTGRITFWNSEKEDGAIENKIYFSKLFCSAGYVPALGDEVCYEAIESNLEKFKWRSLKVTPKEIKSKAKPLMHEQEDIMLMMTNQFNISIKPISLKVDVKYDGVKEVCFDICNSGPDCQLLTSIKQKCHLISSQIKVKTPIPKEGLRIYPKEVVRIDFDIKGRFLGVSEEISIFNFEDFNIKKLIVINVTSNEKMNEFLNCSISTSFTGSKSAIYLRHDIFEGMTFRGPNPLKRRKFIPGEKRGIYKVPEKLWKVVANEDGSEKKKTRSMKELERCVPIMMAALNSETYAERFHTLLYLEEIELKKMFGKLNMNGIILRRRRNYLVIEVSDWEEQKPCPIIGDKVYVKQSWIEKPEVQQMGFIHQINGKSIMVKFHNSFHEKYDESECDVSFEPSLGTVQRAHDAINRAVAKLGMDWLFPNKVGGPKPPQIDFEIDEQESCKCSKESCASFADDMKKLECDVDENGYVIRSKRRLVWFNKSLNEMQKDAIVNVLKGEGRPLPYIIFGPPGTGKTITLVELALQIYHMIPGSRILLATPSNSSCDLLCERLIDAGKFKPGQLVRLIAHHRAMSGHVPSNLIPYTTLLDISDGSDRYFWDELKKNKTFKVSSRNELLGRQRIVAGTCSCVGNMHYLGLPSDHFTHILIDEAGQTTEPDFLIPATFECIQSGQIIMAGDPQQLGPVCFSRLAISYGFGVSIMQRFLSMFPYQRDFESFPDKCGYDPRFVTKLQLNYRSVPEILSLPSEMFYNKELITTVSEDKGVEGDFIKKFDFKGTGREKPASIIFHNILGENLREGDSPSWFNPHEVWQIVMYLKKVYKLGLTCDDVGIITPYVKQAQKIKYVLDGLNMAKPKIGTVEDFQGQERLVVILSVVRSNLVNSGESNVLKLLGFLTCPQRLNVALTRARALMIILGNAVYLSKDSHWRHVIRYCKEKKCLVGSNVISLKQDEEERGNP